MSEAKGQHMVKVKVVSNRMVYVPRQVRTFFGMRKGEKYIMLLKNITDCRYQVNIVPYGETTRGYHYSYVIQRNYVITLPPQNRGATEAVYIFDGDNIYLDLCDNNG